MLAEKGAVVFLLAQPFDQCRRWKIRLLLIACWQVAAWRTPGRRNPSTPIYVTYSMCPTALHGASWILPWDLSAAGWLRAKFPHSKNGSNYGNILGTGWEKDLSKEARMNTGGGIILFALSSTHCKLLLCTYEFPSLNLYWIVIWALLVEITTVQCSISPFLFRFFPL